MALREQYRFPFSTISCAMSVASTMDCIYILPGFYNESVVFKPGVNIRGINTNSVIIQQLITTMGFQSQTGVGGTLSSFAILYKNGNPVSTPNFILPLTNTNTLNYLSTSSLTILATDTYGIFLSTSSSNTAMSNPIITLTLN
jgi:hypothetical protein